MSRIGIFTTEGFRDVEIDFLRRRLEEADHEVIIIAVDQAFSALDPVELCGAVLPDGHWPADKLLDERAKRFLRVLHMAGRPIAAISGGVRILIAAGIGRGCALSASPSDQVFLEEAGARLIDAPVATHGHIISGHGPDSSEDVMDLFLPALEVFQQLTPTEYLLETHPPE